MSNFEIAILGLGLMGGSLAHALRGFKGCQIVGYDINPSVSQMALAAGAIDREAASLEDAAATADLVICCSSPESILANMKSIFPYLKEGALLTDICGIKKDILSLISSGLPPHAEYIGLHPMAGKEVGGFENADAKIFANAGFIIILPERYTEGSLNILKDLCVHVGAGRIVINNADEHDDIIAYTSDLMHISAVSLCASYPANMTMAHTAGAFRDCTRIANIDAALWTELLTQNGQSIVPYLDMLINNLTNFSGALKRGDKQFIHDYLQNASDNKKKILSL